MMLWTRAQEALSGLIELGGPVVALLLVLSVLALAVILWKLAQFAALGVGRHRRIREAMGAVDRGDTDQARAVLAGSRNALAPVLAAALSGRRGQARVEAEASGQLARLERGFRLLDSIAQIAPLLGLFGTVLGMINAFQALQDAGSAVDPSLLAGGIWVALLTTAAGLAVAMPTSLLLTFFESRVARERVMAGTAIETIYHPGTPPQTTPAGPGHGA